MSNLLNMGGKVHRVINENGKSKKGTDWSKRTVVVNNGSDFNELVPIVFFGDRMQNANCKEGDEVSVSFYLGGKEFNGKFYADISGNTLEVKGAQQAPQQAQTVRNEPVESDLPF